MSSDRGVVLVMILGIVATLTVVAAAFLMSMAESYRAAGNSTYQTQAELACRAGLEHARWVIRAVPNLPDHIVSLPDAGWAPDTDTFFPPDAPSKLHLGAFRYFLEFCKTCDDCGDDEVCTTDEFCSCTAGMHVVGERVKVPFPSKWLEGIKHYEGEYFAYRHETPEEWHKFHAERHDLEVDGQKLGEYFVFVADLDGKLHANLAKWENTDIPDYEADLRTLLKGLVSEVLPDEVKQSSLADACLNEPKPQFSSLSEIGRAAGLSASETYALERYLTVYPFHDEVDPRPAVNVNTAPMELLKKMFEAIEGFDDTVANELAAYVVQSRPFENRADWEDAIRLVSGDDAPLDLGDDAKTTLSERQFNDVLNSTAGPHVFGSRIQGGYRAFEAKDSAYDDSESPGLYSFDLENHAQTGGLWTDGDGDERGVADGDLPGDDDNVTWSTEFKFDSRFFHIYVLGRGWVEVDQGGTKLASARGVRRLHAIYDSQEDKILWQRWNLTERGSVTD